MIKKNLSGIGDFRATQVTYNRNGVSGQPFWSVAFQFTSDGALYTNMLAVIPIDDNADTYDETKTFVVDMNDPSECWRGTSFFALAMRAVDAYKVKRNRSLGLKRG